MGASFPAMFKVTLLCLASYHAIFCHIRHTAMAAEVPDLHNGDLVACRRSEIPLLVLVLLVTKRVLNNC